MELTDKELQKQLKALAKASNDYANAIYAIDSHCKEVYGVSPADVDNDDFLDKNAGLCGEAEAMTVKEFKKSMDEAVDFAR